MNGAVMRGMSEKWYGRVIEQMRGENSKAKVCMRE